MASNFDDLRHFLASPLVSANSRTSQRSANGCGHAANVKQVAPADRRSAEMLPQEVGALRCIRCELTVADLWRWCPECGGEVDARHPEIDLRDTDSQFAVEWSDSEPPHSARFHRERRGPLGPLATRQGG
jgi:hypothetical protein